MTAVFAWAESAGASAESTPRVASTKFGDGYEQRAPDGLNPIAETYTVPFRGVSRAGGDEIIAFLRAQVSPVTGLEPFAWTPLWATQPILVVCRGWTRTQGDQPDESDISAKFERVHLP